MIGSLPIELIGEGIAVDQTRIPFFSDVATALGISRLADHPKEVLMMATIPRTLHLFRQSPVGVTGWLIMMSVPLLAADRDWNQFRGPRGNGVSEEKGLPLEWSEGSEAILWKTAIHGKGWSSPVIWQDDVWLTTASTDGTRLFAVCVDRTSGRIRLDIEVFKVADPQFCHPTNSYASCTPFIDDERVYVHFGRYGTACLERRSGRILWSRRDLPYDDFRGPASSPVVHGRMVYFNCDGVDQQYVVALDKISGTTVWKKDRNIDYGTDNGDRKKAYGTPTIITHEGQTQLVSPSATETISYDPSTGNVIWRIRHGGMNAAARPLYGHGLVYISAGEGRNAMVAVRPDGSGDVTGTHIQWNSGQSIPRRSSQILHGDLLFMIDDGGVASCLNALTGKTLWRHRFGGAYWASPICADGRIYFASKEGRMPVIRAADSFELLAENSLGSGLNASPAVAERSLIVRSFTHLYCIAQP